MRNGTVRRATIYFAPEVHRALRLKAAATDRSISDMVNATIKRSLAEDVAELGAFEKRRKEPDAQFHVQTFSNFEAAEKADHAFYASLSPQERLEMLLELVHRHQESKGETSERLERVYRIAELSGS